MALDIHEREKQSYEKHLKAFQECEIILPENKKITEKLLQNIEANQPKEKNRLTLDRTLMVAKRICEFTDKPFAVMNEDDVRKLYGKFTIGYDVEYTEKDHHKKLPPTHRAYATATLNKVKTIIKALFKIAKDDLSPKETRWLKVTMAKTNLVKNDLITVEELGRLVNMAEGIRNKAFLSVHYELGTRIEETLGVQIKEVSMDDKGAIIYVQGKTGRRGVRIITSAPILGEYLNTHPQNTNPEAPLWVKSDGQPLTYNATRLFLRRLFRRAGIPIEKAKTHRFRHSRITETAKFMGEGLQRTHYGWTPDSRMAGIYQHLAASDVDDALLTAYEKKPKTESKPLYINPTCPRCQIENIIGSVYCVKCGFRLNSQITETITNDLLLNFLKTLLLNEKAVDALADIVQEPELMKQIEDVVKVANLPTSIYKRLKRKSTQPTQSESNIREETITLTDDRKGETKTEKSLESVG